jgi:hypothetical protein
LVAATVLASAAALAAPKAAAADSPAGKGQWNSNCTYGHTHTPSGTCMTKADFDETRAREAALDADPSQYMRNALVRCERLAGDDRKDCVSRIQGQGTKSGSVEGGGIYRELITREVGVAVVKAPDDVVPGDAKK